MFLHQAVEIALKEKKCIKRSGSFWKRSIIKPTNSQIWCCVVIAAESKEPYPRWNPTADDLTADDWEVTEGFRPDWEPSDEALTEEYLGIRDSDRAFV